MPGLRESSKYVLRASGLLRAMRVNFTVAAELRR